MFSKVDKCEHDTEAKEARKEEANFRASSHRIYWRVARCFVEERSVREELRGVWFEREEAVRAIRERTVGIIRPIPLLQCRKVKMYASDEGVAGVVAFGEWQGLSYVDRGHFDCGVGRNAAVDEGQWISIDACSNNMASSTRRKETREAWKTFWEACGWSG